MVIDTSAIAAIILDEPERDVFSRLIAGESLLALSAVTLYEAWLVAANRKGASFIGQVDKLISGFDIEIVACDFDQSATARDAYLRYGRGWHPARLNFADCFSYALARLRNEPLLFKGNDFSKTDIVPAWRP